MGFNLSSALDSGERMAAGAAAASDVGIMPPIYYEETTERIELKDAGGSVIGYADVTSGFGYTYTTNYDVDSNYLGSEYVDDSGYHSSNAQTTQRDGSGNVTGYLLVSSGGNSDYSYASSDEYDSEWQLIHSEYSDSQGYAAETVQTVLRDSSGNVTGYAISSSGGDSGSQYLSQASYDANWNLINSSYSDGSGYHSSYVETILYDSAGKVTGYDIVSSGSGGGFGEYSSTERLDADRSLVSSTYSDSSGYYSTYELETEYDSSGKITGYITTSAWTEGTDTYSSTQHYDANWIWLNGDDPPVVIDDGPKSLPVLTMTSEDRADSASVAAGAGGNADANMVADTVKVADTLYGTEGDDVFILSDRSDRVAERGGGGEDSVISSTLSLNLGRPHLDGIFNAGLTGSADLDLTGDGHANTLSGNAGDNHLNGRKGADMLFGGSGSDVFLFDRHSLKQADTIIDFTVGTDTIGLSKKTFANLVDGDGQLDAAAWGDVLRYDADSGALIYTTHGRSITIALIGTVEGLDRESFSFF